MISIRLNINRPIFDDDYSMSIRGISLTSHQSARTMVILSHEMITYQHHSDVVLQSQGISLMRCNITCSLGFFCLDWIVCFISLTDGCIVTCRALLFLYCWRVRSFRFFCLAVEFDCCWVTAGGVSDCGAYGVDVTVCWVAACLIASCLTHSWRMWLARSWRILTWVRKNSLDESSRFWWYQSVELASLMHSSVFALYSYR